MSARFLTTQASFTSEMSSLDRSFSESVWFGRVAFIQTDFYSVYADIINLLQNPLHLERNAREWQCPFYLHSLEEKRVKA